MEDEQKSAQESLESSLEYSQDTPGASAPPPPQPDQTPPKPSGFKSILARLKSALASHWSVYLPIFVLVVAALIIVSVVAYRHENAKPALAEQNLSPSQLNSLEDSSQTVGSSNQVLTVQSSAIFNGQVLVKGQLQVAGQLQISQLQINKSLDIAGDAAIQGTLAVQNDLSVNGNGSFAGNLTTPQLTTNALQLNGDLTLTHHIIAGGPIPNRTTQAATGGGGTTSVNGSDTAGTVTINTGSNPYAGCYISVVFTTPFIATPHMLLTPVGSSAATLSYYVNRSTTSFSVCSDTSPQAGQSYVFDYFVID